MRSFISYRSLVRVVVVAAALVVNSAEVRGDSAPGEAAREALVQARQASDAGRLPEAIEAYKRAYELSGDLSLLFQLGEVNRRLGQDVAAIRFYRSYLARDPRGKYREAAERAARALELQPSKPAPAAAVAPPAPRWHRPPPRPRVFASHRPPSRPRPFASRRHRRRLPPRPRPFASRRHRFPSWRRRHLSHPRRRLRRSQPPRPLLTCARMSPRLRSRGLARRCRLAVVGGPRGDDRAGRGRHRHGVRRTAATIESKASCGRTTEGCSTSDIDQVKSSALTANLLWAATGVGAVATGVIVFVNAREAGFAGVWSF